MNGSQPKTHEQEHASADSIVDSNPRNQFGISALFWLTFMTGLGVSYLREQGSTEILLGGLGGVTIGLCVGLVLGMISGRISDAVFWATLIAAFGYIATVGDPASDWQHRLIWASVGAVSGAVGAVVFPGRIFINTIACAAVAGGVMLTFWAVTQRQTTDMKFDLFAAPVIGACVALFLRSLVWLESQRKMPRYITATWLLIVVIVGNSLSR